MTLVLQAEEAGLLAEVLSEYLGDLRTEILCTDFRDYRERLKHKEHLLRGLLGRLELAAIPHQF